MPAVLRTLLPLVHVLVHSDDAVHLVVVQVDGLGVLKLPAEHRHSRPHLVKVHTVAVTCRTGVGCWLYSWYSSGDTDTRDCTGAAG